jgi:hypothetical protein
MTNKSILIQLGLEQDSSTSKKKEKSPAQQPKANELSRKEKPQQNTMIYSQPEHARCNTNTVPHPTYRKAQARPTYTATTALPPQNEGGAQG